MKKAVFTALLVFSMLLVNTGAAFAGSALELISVTNGGGGPTFTFRVSGGFSPGQLKGSGQVSGGEGFPLHCAQQDETTVICHAPRKISGQSVSVTFGGATFWTDVPQPQLGGGGGNSQYCYGAWANNLFSSVTVTYGPNGDPSSITSLNGQSSGWQDYGPICQDELGVAAPTVGYDHFILDTSNGKAFLLFYNSGLCGQNHGPAYYAVTC